MRASRLVSLLLLLQARGRLTADMLAEELEVSVRTVYRDLVALGAAGVPVYGERGQGGGYQLLDGYRTNLTGLTGQEAGALLMAGAPGPAAELGLGALLAATRLKLLAAVPPAPRETATRAEERFYLDPGGWAHQRARDDRCLRTVARAVWNDRRLEVSYRRAGGRAARRALDPLGLVHKTGVWRLVASHEGDTRVYRVDRMLAAQELEAASCRPDAFALTAFWERWEAEYAAALPALPSACGWARWRNGTGTTSARFRRGRWRRMLPIARAASSRRSCSMTGGQRWPRCSRSGPRWRSSPRTTCARTSSRPPWKPSSGNEGQLQRDSRRAARERTRSRA